MTKASSASPAPAYVWEDVKMKNACLQYRCIKCCLDTKMPLSNSDIVRIRSLGFPEDFFVLKKNVNRRLRNLSGRCVFHNGQRCTIYNCRPEGCQIYPVVFSDDVGEAVLDSYCPHHGKFQLTPGISRKVIRLVRKLDAEKTHVSETHRNAQRQGIRESKPSAY